MPAQRPHRSKQDVQTDPALIAAVIELFGPLVVDLAAGAENAQAAVFFDEAHDSLVDPWAGGGLPTGNRWLNPPFENIAPWAEKCAANGTRENRIFFHVPASVGSNWFRDHVAGKALVLFLNGRVTYVGHTQPYPKDCIIAIYGEPHGYAVWSWK